MRTSGVYRITCDITNKVYIGSSSSCVYERMIHHRKLLRSGKHHSILLQRAWDKYLEHHFKFELVEVCDPSMCTQREQVWMDHYKSYNPNKGFNISPTASSTLGCTFPTRKPKGPEHSLSGINKSIALKGMKKSKEHAKAVGEARKVPIIQMDSNYQFIKEWPSGKDAEDTLHISRQQIASCCNGNRVAAGGYRWEHKKNYNGNS